MIVTPADILARCNQLSARIDSASQVIAAASAEQLDPAFREAWNARLRRWAEVREQCGDWGSRWWNTKWAPTLDDWFGNQATWEKQIEARTGRVIPIPAQRVPDERPTLPGAVELGAAGRGLAMGVGVGIVGVLGLAYLALRQTKG